MTRFVLMSVAASLLCFVAYLICLKYDSRLLFRRIILLSILPFSLVFPLIHIHNDVLPSVIPPVYLETVPAVFQRGSSLSPELPRNSVGIMQNIAVVVYFFVFAMLLLLSVISLLKVLRRLNSYTFQTSGDCKVAFLDEEMSSFSFFKYIVVGCKGLSEDDISAVLAHEKIHAQQMHTLDLLFVRLLCCLMWFNPIAWFVLKELRLLHECVADSGAVARLGYTEYLNLLFRQSTGEAYHKITNSFATFISYRIKMIKFGKKSHFAKLIVVSIVLIAVLTSLTVSPSGRTYDIPDGEYVDGEGMSVLIKKGKPMGHRWYTVDIPVDLDPKTELFEDRSLADARFDELKEKWRYSELVTAKPIDSQGDTIYELRYTNDGSNWLALKQQNQPYVSMAEIDDAVLADVYSSILKNVVCDCDTIREHRMVLRFTVDTLCKAVDWQVVKGEEYIGDGFYSALSALSDLTIAFSPSKVCNRKVQSYFYLPIIFLK